MTTEQIATALFRSKSTVEKWVRKTCAESAEVKLKVEIARNIQRPADYSIDECCLIVEKGMGVGAAALFKERTFPNGNGMHIANGKVYDSDARLDRMERILERLTDLIIETVKPSLIQPLQISCEYFTVKGHCNNIGIKQGMGDMMKLGKECARLSRMRGIEIRQVDDEHYGHLNSYHIDILKEVFAI